VQDIRLNQRINRLYLQVKYDTFRLAGPLTLAMRRVLYGEVKRLLLDDVARGMPAHHLEVDIDDGLTLPEWSIKRRLVYDVGPKAEIDSSSFKAAR
jgi:hypothetical protein